MNHIDRAQKVWQLYISGMSKSKIAREIPMNRSEVVGIIKYTTKHMYLTDLAKEHEELNIQFKRCYRAYKKFYNCKLAINGKVWL